MDESLSLSNPKGTFYSVWEKLGLFLLITGMLLLILGGLNWFQDFPLTIFLILVISFAFGSGFYIYGAYVGKPSGIKNNHNFLRSLSARGLWGWMFGIAFTLFYVLLYWYPSFLGYNEEGTNTGIVAFFDPLSLWLKGKTASQWFMYGTLYTIAILFMGVKFMYKYRHNVYQKWRTLSIMFFQLSFAFLIPEILLRLNQPYMDFKHIWPLNYYAFYDWKINELISSGQLGLFMLIWSVALILIVTPILTYFYGKRWYCSWVCGCGGLAETAGDPWRHLSDKSLTAWRVERWLIHAVLFFAVLMTAAVVYGFLYQSTDPIFNLTFINTVFTIILGGLVVWVILEPKRFRELDKKAKYIGIVLCLGIIILMWTGQWTGRQDLIWIPSYQINKVYGFLIGAAFSGVVGVGFYPLMGSRVWCRFGCPMAAILGIQQKFFSKFRITTNGSQCISCGNCSTYCEMGIDVKAYAQRGQDIVRASCVGCGICSAVCPRGVLRLENGPDTTNKADAVRVLQIDQSGVKFDV